MKDDRRPVNLALHTMKFPITAVTSILHRISGFLIFFGIPLSLWVLNLTLNAPDSFDSTMAALNSPLGKFGVWAFLSALLFHLIMGIRHLIMDFGLGETLKGGRIGAWAALICAAVAVILAGVWVW